MKTGDRCAGLEHGDFEDMTPEERAEFCDFYEAGEIGSPCPAGRCHVGPVLAPSPDSARRAALYMLANGRWHGEVTGPGNALCGTSSPSLEAVVSFLVRRLLAAPVGACADGCEAKP